MTTAQIILNQIKAQDKMALWAWGARDYVNTGNGIQFRVNGSNTKRGSWCKITLNGKDLYDIEIYRIYKADIKTDSTANDVYADMLIQILDELIG